MAGIRFVRTFAGGVALLLVLAASGLLHARATSSPDAPNDADAIRHVLNRITFGPRPGDVEQIQRTGLQHYIERQLHPERIQDAAIDGRLEAFSTLTMSSEALAERYFLPAMQLQQQRQAQAARADAAAEPEMRPNATMAPSEAQMAVQPAVVANELMQARLLRAAGSERQLQEVLVDFWFNHFNVFIGKGQVRQYLTEYERDVIRPHVLGSFRELLGAVARSPAMLIYLDNWQSAAAVERVDTRAIERRLNDSRLSPAARQQLVERLQRLRQAARQARGLNENYARELLELHTLGVEGGYTQDDVVALARIFTGWTVDQPRRGGSFVFRPAMHDTASKVLLGQTFESAGQSEGERALDLLASHPSTARHIAFKLAQRFVADDPPAALVDRAARVFLETGGNLRDVVRAIVTSPEFFDDSHRRAKIKTPLEFVVSAIRATDATIVNAQPLVAALRTLGMPLYGCQPPTGYGMSAADWVNTGALIARMNLAIELVNGTTPQRPANLNAGAVTGGPAQVRQRAARGPVRIDLAWLAPDTTNASRQTLMDTLLGGVVSDATRDTLTRADTPQQLVALALGSPEFQRR